MTTQRALILTGMGAGALWALASVPLARAAMRAVQLPLPDALSLAFLPCGVVLLAMITRLAQRRFFDDAIIDGSAFRAGSPADIDQRVLRNTMEQGLLAVLLWPFIGLVLGGGPVLLLGASFAVTRVLFWLGYHVSPPLRAFGFAAGLYPTIVLLGVAVFIGAVQGRFHLL